MLLIIEEQQALQSWRWRLVACRSAEAACSPSPPRTLSHARSPRSPVALRSQSQLAAAALRSPRSRATPRPVTRPQRRSPQPAAGRSADHRAPRPSPLSPRVPHPQALVPHRHGARAEAPRRRPKTKRGKFSLPLSHSSAKTTLKSNFQ